MENLKIRHLLVMPVIAAAAAMTINSCATDPIPARSYPKNEAAALIKNKQDAADAAVQKLQAVYSRMSDQERMRGVVYE
ncbi:hypothetical protein [Neisseria sp. S1]|uniref:hypothetical protein n=1 Tax=Neisseria sp. S1 TaxID=3318354 RepID=UPI003A8B4123